MGAQGIRRRGALGGCAVVLAVSGCGSDNNYANEPRPPSPITVTASISGQRVSVSPTPIGAGPITLVVTNQTDRSRELVLESDDAAGSGKAGIRQQTGPINPQGTASLKANLETGTYAVRVKGDSIRAGRLEVGRERASAQNELLQP